MNASSFAAKKILVVGAGFTGCVIAERVSNALKLPVTVIEKRNHVGGNCWSEIDQETGIEVHKYGPHIFHTSNREVWDYICRFTDWNNYQHRVWTRHNGGIYSMPINLATINNFYGKNLNPEEAKSFIASEAAKECIKEPANLEEKAVSQIGRPLYEAFIKGYTIKQWEKDPKELAPEIITRLPVRFNYDNNYFNDLWQGIPLHGYAALFEKMLDNPLIDVRLEHDWSDMRHTVEADTLVIYTGPIDAFFDYRHGHLEWRTLDFEVRRYPVDDFQGAAQVNEADATVGITRKTEYRHFHPEEKYPDSTVVVEEAARYANISDEPYYPVNTEQNRKLYSNYEQDAKKLPNVIFAGRLGEYKYFDMDDSIARAMKTADTITTLIIRQ